MNVESLRMILQGEGVPVHAMKAFLTTALDVGELSASHLGYSTSSERAHTTYWRDGWLNPQPFWTFWSKEMLLSLPGTKLPIIHPVVSHFLLTIQGVSRL